VSYNTLALDGGSGIDTAHLAQTPPPGAEIPNTPGVENVFRDVVGSC
jgi:hypothetical protein